MVLRGITHVKGFTSVQKRPVQYRGFIKKFSLFRTEVKKMYDRMNTKHTRVHPIQSPPPPIQPFLPVLSTSSKTHQKETRTIVACDGRCWFRRLRPVQPCDCTSLPSSQDVNYVFLFGNLRGRKMKKRPRERPWIWRMKAYKLRLRHRKTLLNHNFKISEVFRNISIGTTAY